MQYEVEVFDRNEILKQREPIKILIEADDAKDAMWRVKHMIRGNFAIFSLSGPDVKADELRLWNAP